MNRGTYGYPLPPNYATRVPPSRWTNARAYTVAGTYTGFVVPANVFQIGLMVVGAGGSGAMATPNNGYLATGGGGGGFAFGILDVTPGQVLPTITVGAGGAALNTVSGVNGNAGGTSSFGTIVTCTGGGGGNTSAVKTDAAGGVGGTATVTGLRNSVASTGGRGGNITSLSSNYKTTGGGAPGGFFNSGNGGDIVAVTGTHESHATGGAGWGGNGSGLNPSVSFNTNGMAYGGGAFNFNGASIIPFPSSTPFVASSGTGTAGVGYFMATAGATLGGNGIIGAPSNPLVPVSGGTAFTTQPAAGSGFLSSNASNPYLLLVDLNFGGAGGNSFVNSTTTNAAYSAGSGGNGGGGGGITNVTSTGSFTAGDGGVAGGGGGLVMGITTVFLRAGSGGFFAGGGALSAGNSSTYAIAGSGGNGGGGGGISTGSSTTRLSGAGGDGAVILYWTDGY